MFFLSKFYLILISIIILLNTIILALDQHPPNNFIISLQNNSNIGFTIIFTIEFLLKLYAFGIINFFKDKFNVFDSIIVISSIIDLIYQSILTNSGGELSTLQTFRAIRLVRMFKLLRSSKNLRNLLKALFQSVISLKYFSILLFIFMVICTFVGNELFAYRVRFLDGGEEIIFENR